MAHHDANPHLLDTWLVVQIPLSFYPMTWYLYTVYIYILRNSWYWYLNLTWVDMKLRLGGSNPLGGSLVVSFFQCNWLLAGTNNALGLNGWHQCINMTCSRLFFWDYPMWQPGLIVYKSHKFTIHCRGLHSHSELLGISRMGAGKSPTKRLKRWREKQPGDLVRFFVVPQISSNQLLKPNVDCKPASMPIIAGELTNFYLFGSA